jgi:hypothetical protein
VEGFHKVDKPKDFGKQRSKSATRAARSSSRFRRGKSKPP